MKKILSEISGYFKIEKLRNDKRIVVFIICLSIATALWFLNALSKDYSTTIAFPVKYIDPPENQFLAVNPPSKFDLKVTAHGFTLLRHKLSLSFSPIVLNLTSITQNIEKSGDSFNVNTRSLINRISTQVSKEITINDITPAILRITLDSLKTKRVPVKENIEIQFKPQFDLKDSVSISPNEVEITGAAAVIDTIAFLHTKAQNFEKLDADIEKMIELILPERTVVRPEKVMLKIPVERFTEKKIKIPISVKNKPEDKYIKLFPSEIELTTLVGLSEFENVKSSNFEVFVDFEKIDYANENLSVSVQSNVSQLKIIRFTPETVEYLIESD